MKNIVFLIFLFICLCTNAFANATVLLFNILSTKTEFGTSPTTAFELTFFNGTTVNVFFLRDSISFDEDGQPYSTIPFGYCEQFFIRAVQVIDITNITKKTLLAEVVNSTLTIRTFQKNFVTELEDNGLMDSVFKASSIYKVVTFTWFEIYADALVNVFISAFFCINDEAFRRQHRELLNFLALSTGGGYGVTVIQLLLMFYFTTEYIIGGFFLVQVVYGFYYLWSTGFKNLVVVVIFSLIMTGVQYYRTILFEKNLNTFVLLMLLLAAQAIPIYYFYIRESIIVQPANDDDPNNPSQGGPAAIQVGIQKSSTDSPNSQSSVVSSANQQLAAAEKDELHCDNEETEAGQEKVGKGESTFQNVDHESVAEALPKPADVEHREDAIGEFQKEGEVGIHEEESEIAEKPECLQDDSFLFEQPECRSEELVQARTRKEVTPPPSNATKVDADKEDAEENRELDENDAAKKKRSQDRGSTPEKEPLHTCEHPEEENPGEQKKNKSKVECEKPQVASNRVDLQPKCRSVQPESKADDDLNWRNVADRSKTAGPAEIDQRSEHEKQVVRKECRSNMQVSRGRNRGYLQQKRHSVQLESKADDDLDWRKAGGDPQSTRGNDRGRNRGRKLQ